MLRENIYNLNCYITSNVAARSLLQHVFPSHYEPESFKRGVKSNLLGYLSVGHHAAPLFDSTHVFRQVSIVILVASTLYKENNTRYDKLGFQDVLAL